MPDVGQGMPYMSYQHQEILEYDALITCHWNSWSSTFWGYSMLMSSTSE